MYWHWISIWLDNLLQPVDYKWWNAGWQLGMKLYDRPLWFWLLWTYRAKIKPSFLFSSTNHVTYKIWAISWPKLLEYLLCWTENDCTSRVLFINFDSLCLLPCLYRRFPLPALDSKHAVNNLMKLFKLLNRRDWRLLHKVYKPYLCVKTPCSYE